MVKCNLSEAGKLVDSNVVFKCNKSLFSEYHGSYANGFYVVYSYGYHFPLFAYCLATGQWYGNDTKSSVTTAKHRSKCRPSCATIKWVSVSEIKAIIGR